MTGESIASAAGLLFLPEFCLRCCPTRHPRHAFEPALWFNASASVLAMPRCLSCDLRCAVGGDDDDGIHAPMGAGFKQERHFVHDDGMRSAFGDTANERPLLSLPADG